MKVCPNDSAHVLTMRPGVEPATAWCAACRVEAVSDKTVNHPPHYTSHPSGVECVDIAEHYGFNVGNAIKYLWRAGLKGDAIEDLKKAVWYIQREIAKRGKGPCTCLDPATDCPVHPVP